VAEAAVVPSPDPLRLAVPKAFIVLVAGRQPGPELARELFQFLREQLPPFKRVRRLEFSELPKTISGKIRRVDLRIKEAERRATGVRVAEEFFEEDFAEPAGPSA
jgi:acetyl-CoA synthetase